MGITNDKVIKVAEKYLIFLQKEFKAKLIRENDEPESVNHLAWMCNEVIQFARENRMGKAFRWLGFIQGAFWVMGMSTIEEMKNDNRPDAQADNLGPLPHLQV